jgi:hypothetical protein
MKFSTRIAAIALAALLLSPAIGFEAIAQSSTQYQSWPGAQQQSKTLQKLLKDLTAMIQQAERDEAASPDFLADLKAFAQRLQAVSMPPQEAAPPLGLRDNFSDGNYTQNPIWKVSAGTWSVDTGGSNVGLVSKIRQQPLNILLGGLLAPQGTQQTQQQYASIYTAVKLPAAFIMTVKMTSKDRYGALNFGPYQGASAQNLYRLVYQPGAQQGLLLQRVSQQNVVNLGVYNGPVNLEDGKVHEITLTRDLYGRMQVLIDGQSAIKASDATITGEFDGFLIVNSGGSYWLRDINFGAKEQ